MNYRKYGIWVQRRIRTITKNWHNKPGLFMVLDEAFDRENSVIFNCMIKQVKYQEFFLEVSKQEHGFSFNELKVFDARFHPRPMGTSKMNLTRVYEVARRKSSDKIYIGLLYHKPRVCWEYGKFLNNYFKWKELATCQKLIENIERMVEDFHQKGFLLPSDWDQRQMVFLDELLRPVLLGAGSVVEPRDNNHFTLGKIRDRKALNKLKWSYSFRVSQSL